MIISSRIIISDSAFLQVNCLLREQYKRLKEEKAQRRKEREEQQQLERLQRSGADEADQVKLFIIRLYLSPPLSLSLSIYLFPSFPPSESLPHSIFPFSLSTSCFENSQ